MMQLSQVLPPAVEPLTIGEVRQSLRIDHDDEDAALAMWLASERQHFEQTGNRAVVAQVFDLALDGFPCEAIRLPRPPLIQVTSIQYRDALGQLQTLDPARYQVDRLAEPARILPAYQQPWPWTQPVANAVMIRYVAGFAVPITVSIVDNTVTAQGAVYQDDDIIRVTSSSELPTPLTKSILYHVVNSTGSTFQLSLTEGGAPIDITDEGAGLHWIGEIPAGILAYLVLMVGHRYENREASSERPLTPVPLAVESLFWANRIKEL